MDNSTTTTNHSRRRSTSLIGPAATVGRSNSLRSQKGHRRTMSEHIAEAAEDKHDLDYGDSSSSGLEDAEGLTDDEETGLTSKDRRKRRRRKRRNTRLDERIASDVTISKEEEEKIATATFVKASLINITLIALWYFFSISISIYNKWMFAASEDGQSNLNFPFPLFTTCLHMVVQFTLASLVLFFFPKFRPRHDSLDSHHDSARAPPRREEPTDPNKPLMTKWFYCTRIGPCGAATGLDIGLGNMSLKFISLTFFTMCKSSVLGFVLLFAFIFRLEKPSWKLGAIILTMTVGVIMMVAGETAFNALGFILIMSSALSSGFRWSLTQILLLRNPATSNPFSSIFFLAPVMFLSLFVIAVPVEGFAELWEGFAQLRAAKGLTLSILILMFPGTLAFLMTASEFALLKRTSVVTLSVCGIFKEIVTITAASLVFDDRLTTINVSGLLVTIGSIAAYNWIKVKQMHEDARLEARLAAEEYQPVLSAEPGDEYHVDGQRCAMRTVFCSARQRRNSSNQHRFGRVRSRDRRTWIERNEKSGSSGSGSGSGSILISSSSPLSTSTSTSATSPNDCFDKTSSSSSSSSTLGVVERGGGGGGGKGGWRRQKRPQSRSSSRRRHFLWDMWVESTTAYFAGKWW